MPDDDAHTHAPRRGPGMLIILLILIAGAMMIAGIAFPKLGWLDAPSAPPTATGGVAPASLTGPNSPTAQAEAGERWGPIVFRLGFSFAAGLLAGYLLRSLFGFTVVAIALAAAALYGLEYSGLVDVHWTAFQSKYESLSAWAQGQFASVKAFITGAVPSVTLAAVGLFLGWRR